MGKNKPLLTVGWSFGNFNPSGTNIFILSGDKVQNITFATAPYSQFNTLILTKPLSTGYTQNVTMRAWGNFYKKLEQLQPVSIQSVSSNLTSPQLTNSSITLTANASGGKKKLYEFWVWKEGEDPKIVREYSSDKSYVWTPKELANYYISVHVKDFGSTKNFDTYKRYDGTFSIVNLPVKINKLNINQSSPQKVSSTIELSTDAVGGSQLLYEYWIWRYGEDPKVVREYSTDNTFNWTPVVPGSYFISVHVKDINSKRTLDAYQPLGYVNKVVD